MPELSDLGLDLSPSPETHPVSIPAVVGHWIGGERVAGGETFEVVEPGAGAPLLRSSDGGQDEVDRAVRAARAAFDGVWGRMPPAERGKVLFRVSRRLQERARELAVLESRNTGKPIREARDFDVPLAAAHFFYYAGWADKLEYAGVPATPIGVAGQIVPWNFPLLMAAWKIAPALAAGNTVVLKPAETTPLTAWALAEILEECELPPGVVNLVNGHGATGELLVEHPGIDKIAFTGSTAVGRRILERTAGARKRVTLELGGKGANIVFADAALDQAVEGVVDGIFFNQGHVCCAGSRLLVEESVAEDFLGRLKRRIQTLRVGDPLDKNTDVGAIHGPRHHASVTRWIARAAEDGAAVWQSPCALPGAGWYVPPTVITGVAQSDPVARDEVFGPVLAVLTFRTPAEAVAKANDSEYGLACGVWTEKASKLFSVAHALNAGVVWANGYNLFDPASPFGGVRHSGFGREGGIAGLWPYLGGAP